MTMHSLFHPVDSSVQKELVSIWPEANWISVQHGPEKQELRFVAGRGHGPALGLKVAELNGAEVRRWYAAHDYKENDPRWKSMDETPTDASLLDMRPSDEQFERLLALRPRLRPNTPYLLVA